ncbi:MAG: CopG family ribbon-helix-helix protein [Alkaliphilus sp.]
MAESKKIIISLPDNLLREIDDIVSNEKTNRSEFIRKAMKMYVREKSKIERKEKMKNGYQEMATINLSIAETGLNLDTTSLENYETRIAECE